MGMTGLPSPACEYRIWKEQSYWCVLGPLTCKTGHVGFSFGGWENRLGKGKALDSQLQEESVLQCRSAKPFMQRGVSISEWKDAEISQEPVLSWLMQPGSSKGCTQLGWDCWKRFLVFSTSVPNVFGFFPYSVSKELCFPWIIAICPLNIKSSIQLFFLGLLGSFRNTCIFMYLLCQYFMLKTKQRVYICHKVWGFFCAPNLYYLFLMPRIMLTFLQLH